VTHNLTKKSHVIVCKFKNPEPKYIQVVGKFQGEMYTNNPNTVELHDNSHWILHEN